VVDSWKNDRHSSRLLLKLQQGADDYNIVGYKSSGWEMCIVWTRCQRQM